ncbi:hypothetical protein FDP41_002630 [Naegleria fowleri]|uniref:PUM-HD domain-containing protein n=1 Tax=Naegleria fowleri TaxID=5763 RepID=A0A6A5BXN9_NAEFO|nr:uncharacterized protein FDP41_002630 [Naegleria fowleri]KAF0978115.1 hypothetical protein FDP41_002630 [Naegleria fowleri]
MKAHTRSFHVGGRIAKFDGMQIGFNKLLQQQQQYSRRFFSSEHRILSEKHLYGSWASSSHLSFMNVQRHSSSSFMPCFFSQQPCSLSSVPKVLENNNNFKNGIGPGFSSSYGMKSFSTSLNHPLNSPQDPQTNASVPNTTSITASFTSSSPNHDSEQESKTHFSNQHQKHNKMAKFISKDQYNHVLLSQLFNVDNQSHRENLLSRTKHLLLNKIDAQASTHEIFRALDVFTKQDIKEIIQFLDEKDLLIPFFKKQFSHMVLMKIFNCAGPEEKSFLIDRCLFSQNVMEMCTGQFSSATVNAFIPGFNLSEMTRFLQILKGISILDLTKSGGGTVILETVLNQLQDPSLKEEYFSMVEPYYSELMTEQHGNYLVQNCISHMTKEQRLRFIELLSKDLKNLCQTSEGAIATRHFLKTSPNYLVRHFFTNIVIPDVGIFANNKFSNFIIEENFSKLYQSERKQVLQGVSAHLVEISKTAHGSMFLKKLFQLADRSDELMVFSKAVKNNLLELSKSTTSSYFVVDDLFTHVLKLGHSRREILNAMISHFLSLIQYTYGSLFMQLMFKSEDVERSELEVLVHIMSNHFDRMLTDAKSAALLRVAIENGFAETFFLKMKGKTFELAQQVHSSYVVVACLQNCNRSTVVQMLRELLLDPSLPNSAVEGEQQVDQSVPLSKERVLTLCRHKSGSFVMLDVFKVIEKYASKEDEEQLLVKLASILVESERSILNYRLLSTAKEILSKHSSSPNSSNLRVRSRSFHEVLAVSAIETQRDFTGI